MIRCMKISRSIELAFMALLLTLGLAGCRYDNIIPDKISMAPPTTGFMPEAEISDVYCVENRESKEPLLDFKFTIKNLTNEAMDIRYFWTLNDPQADGPGYLANINAPIARVYQGQIRGTLPASGGSSPTHMTVNVKPTREYDPRFYRMYISVYRGDAQIGYYAEQKSPFDWDYSILPPVRLETHFHPLPSPEPGTMISIPEGVPIIFAEQDHIMGGLFTYLYICNTGDVLYIEETGLRMPTKEYPPVRTWKTGTISSYELEQLLALFRSAEFQNLDPTYQFPGKPIEGAPSGSFVSGDMGLTISINYANINKTVKTNSYLTPDRGETYPDMPYPLNKLYEMLRTISLSTEKMAAETIPLGGGN